MLPYLIAGLMAFGSYFLYVEYPNWLPSSFQNIPKKSTVISIIVIINLSFLLAFYIHSKIEEKGTRRRIVRWVQKNQVRNARVYEPPNFQFLQKKSIDEYNKETFLYTSKCMAQLRETPQYKQMLQKKGTDEANWNWQTHERKTLRMGHKSFINRSSHNLLAEIKEEPSQEINDKFHLPLKKQLDSPLQRSSSLRVPTRHLSSSIAIQRYYLK